ncbi:MAG TPA: prolipoprotein diacylglyceryl transferase [Thermomicrobiales bacterium]|nr:prolipoprotein diacylglyceryl transferase [Thermomicrobiales bacterium]
MVVSNPVAFSIGPLAVRWYGILIMLGVLAGALLAARLARRKGVNPDYVWEMLPIVVFSAIAGARIYWVFLDWNTCCAQDPLQAFNIRGGGISIQGALAAGILSLWLYTRFKGVRFFRWVDILAPAFALGQAIGRWGNFTNQEAFGGPTSLPWGIYISPDRRPVGYEQYTHFHPTFLYESLADLLTSLVLTWFVLRIDRDKRLRDGDGLWVYLMIYGVVRFFIEGMRTDSLYLGPFKAAQVISVAAIALGLIGLGLRHIGWRGDDEEAEPALAAAGAPAAGPEGDEAAEINGAPRAAGPARHERATEPTPPGTS